MVPDARPIGVRVESRCSLVAPPLGEKDVSPRAEAESHHNEDAQQTMKPMELELKQRGHFWEESRCSQRRRMNHVC